MSNKHYTQYSKFSSEDPMTVNDVENETEEIDEIEESSVIEEPIEGQTIIPELEEELKNESEIRKFGKINGCKKLNVRKLPSRDAEIISELAEGSEVMIDEQASTALFYKVCTEHGIEGYCMKNFIKVLP